MRVNRAAVVVLSILALACSAEPADDAAGKASGSTTVGDVRQAMESTNARLIAAFKAGDADAAAREYAADAQIMAANSPAMVGTAAIAEGLKGWFSSMKIADMTLNATDVMVGGDLAVETGTYTMSMQMPNGPKIDDKGKFVTVWKRQPDGSWKPVRDIMNTDLPAEGR